MPSLRSDNKNQDDVATQAPPLVLGNSTLQQILNAKKSATEEVVELLEYGCDIIIECSICRSLFRSLANFVAHKRFFCKELRKPPCASCTPGLSEQGDHSLQEVITVQPTDALEEHEQAEPPATFVRVKHKRKPGKKDLVHLTKAHLHTMQATEKREHDRLRKRRARARTRAVKEGRTTVKSKQIGQEKQTESVKSTTSEKYFETDIELPEHGADESEGPTPEPVEDIPEPIHATRSTRRAKDKRSVNPNNDEDLSPTSSSPSRASVPPPLIAAPILRTMSQLAAAQAPNGTTRGPPPLLAAPTPFTNTQLKMITAATMASAGIAPPPLLAASSSTENASTTSSVKQAPLEIISIPSTSRGAPTSSSGMVLTSPPGVSSLTFMPQSGTPGNPVRFVPLKLTPGMPSEAPVISNIKLMSSPVFPDGTPLPAAPIPHDGNAKKRSLEDKVSELPLKKQATSPSEVNSHEIKTEDRDSPPPALVMDEYEKEDETNTSQNSLTPGPSGSRPQTRLIPLFPPESPAERVEWEKEADADIGCTEEIKKDFRLTANDIKERSDCDWRSLTCLKCISTYSCMKTLVKHMANQHSDKRVFFPCIYCNNIYAQNKNVIRHLVMHHGKTMKFISHIRDFLRSLAFVRTLSHSDSQRIAANEKEFMDKIKSSRGDTKVTMYSSMTDDEIIDKFGKRVLDDGTPRNGRPPKNREEYDTGDIVYCQRKRNRPVFPCPECDNKYAQLRNVVRHLKRQHGKNSLELLQMKDSLQAAAYMEDSKEPYHNDGEQKKERISHVIGRADQPSRQPCVLDDMLAKAKLKGNKTSKPAIPWSEFKTNLNESIKFKKLSAPPEGEKTEGIYITPIPPVPPAMAKVTPPATTTTVTSTTILPAPPLVSMLTHKCRVCHKSFNNQTALSIHSERCEQTDSPIVSNLLQKTEQAKQDRKESKTKILDVKIMTQTMLPKMKSLISKARISEKTASDKSLNPGKVLLEDVLAAGDGITLLDKDESASETSSLPESVSSRKSMRTPKPKKMFDP